MNKKQRIWIFTGMILFAAFSRVFFYNYGIFFSPVIAMALFGGACMQDKKYSFALPLMAMFLSDVMFELFYVAPGFWGWGQLVNYGALLAITFIGLAIRKISVFSVVTASLFSSIVFFLISNTGVWAFDHAVYAKSFTGWLDCLVMGLPFLKNGLIADLFYSSLFFGLFELGVRRLKALDVVAKR